MACLTPYINPLGHSFPCGKCPECAKRYSLMWSQRIMDELASAGDVGCFLTLTYNNENLPGDGQLRKTDLQKFMKRLRKLLPCRIRYFACGEYGGKGNRPHYHVILFGYRPADMVELAPRRFASKTIERVWKLGFVSLGDITLESALYCAKYMTKCDSREHKVKPFTVMSRRPGLGYFTINPSMLLTGERYISGKRFIIPPYYLDQLNKRGFDAKTISRSRYVFMKNAFVDGVVTDEMQRKLNYQLDFLHAFRSTIQSI